MGLKELTKNILPEQTRFLFLPWRKQFKNFKTLSKKYGQYSSIKGLDCVDEGGKKLPWYTYPAIEYLAQFDFSKETVMEFGSGNSSVWWAGKCEKLISVEHDKVWFDKISHRNKGIANFDYRFAEKDSGYCSQKEMQTAGVIIIDGIERKNCALEFISQLELANKNCSMLIFDNSDWYPETMALIAKKSGWVQCDFLGFGPINSYCWATSVFINPNRPLSRRCTIIPISGVAKIAEEDKSAVIVPTQAIAM